MKQRGHILLKDKFIYFANDGLPFDREGVIAISKHNISSKGGNEEDKPIDLFKNITDSKWIEAQHKHSIKNYINEPNNIGADRKSETEAAKDYVGRWLFEVLQNMDDAIGPKDFKKFIGTKGLGFLSVLNVGHTPEIFSGEFNFKFSKTLTTEALLNSDDFDKSLEKYAKNPPMFQVFHPANKDENIISFFKKDFKTVIKLEILEEHKENIISDLKNIDHKFLIFSRNINKLTLKIDEDYEKSFEKKSQNISHNKELFKDKISIKIYDHLIKYETQEQWILWGRQWKSNAENNKLSSCMIALPFDGEKCFSLEYYSNFYNFFPTNNNSKTFALFHLTFQLSQDRNNLQMWGKEYNWESENCSKENITILDNLKKLLLKDLINDCFVNPKLILEVFQDLNNDEDVLIYSPKKMKGEVHKKLKFELISFINNEAFIPVYGNGFCSLTSLYSWKYKLIDCFYPTKNIRSSNLAYEEINYERELLQKYNVSEVDIDILEKIISENDLKNNNHEECEKCIELIVKYIKEEDTYYSTIFDLNLFKNEKYELTNLNSGPFFSANFKGVPDFLVKNRLSKQSEKLIKKYFKDLSNEFEDELSSKFIENQDQLLASLPDFISNSFSWKEDGYELLRYLINIHSNDTKDIFSDRLKNSIYLPTDRKDIWNKANNIYLSKQWGASDGFISWCENLTENRLLKIKSKKSLLDEINKKQNRNNKLKIKFKDVKDFFIFCGVRDYPNIRKADIDEIKHTKTYNKYNRLTSSTYYRWVYNEYFYPDIESFFNGLKFSDSCLMVSNMIKEAVNFVSEYKNRRGAYYSVHRKNNVYANFGLFQLANLRWIKHKRSIIRMDGYFSPLEIIISSKPSFQIFPQINKKDLISKNNISKEVLDYIIEELDINKNNFTRDNLLEFFFKDNNIEQNYQKLIENNEKRSADTQLREIYNYLSNFFPVNRDKYDYFTDIEIQDVAFPCISIDSPNNDFHFFKKDTVLFNDTNLSLEELKKLKFLSGFGIYFGNKNNFNFELLSNQIDVKIEYDTIAFKDLDDLFNFLEERWPLIVFIQKLNNINIKVTFEEFKERTIFCKQIDIYISSSENKDEVKIKKDEWRHENKFFIKLDLKDTHETFMNVVCKHICRNLFKNGHSFALLRGVVDCNTKEKLRNFFSLNDIDPLTFSDYEYLHYQNEITMRNIDFNNEQIEIDKNKKEINKNLSDKVDTVKSKQKNSKSNQLEKVLKTQSDIVKKNKGQKNNSPSKSFGKRLSGHFRPINPRGVKVRDYFDDESNNNKAIGEKGEELVFNLLKDQGYNEVTLRGSNNKGFDIEYLDGDETHFIEVKTLKGFWEDSDVLLSKAQFEWAQSQKDKYTICVVENISSKKDTKVYKINNPAEYFTKLQIDHGWKDFAAQIDKIPEIGNIIEINGQEFKILNVTKFGKEFRLELSDKTKIFYKPEMMILKDKKDLN